MYHYESKSRGYEASAEKHERFLKETEYMKNKWKNKIDVAPHAMQKLLIPISRPIKKGALLRKKITKNKREV